MPKAANSHVFRTAGRPGNYQWNQWLDGKKREFSRPNDFLVSVAAFVSAAYLAAKRRGLKIRSNRLSANTVVIQAITVKPRGPGRAKVSAK
jgi:hypothetical protein